MIFIMARTIWTVAVVIIGLTLVAISSIASAQQWEYVATLSSDASRDETILHVEVIKPISEGRSILIESRDGTVRELYGVDHVYHDHVLLDRKLNKSYLSGARLFQ